MVSVLVRGAMPEPLLSLWLAGEDAHAAMKSATTPATTTLTSVLVLIIYVWRVPPNSPLRQAGAMMFDC